MAIYDLKLTYDSLVLVVNHWTSYEAARAQPKIGGGISYSAKGNTLETGTSFELPYFWTITTLLTESERQILSRMWSKVDASRRSLEPTSNRIITLDDETERIEESTQTRTIVSGTTSISLPDGGVSYFAQFSALMPERPKFVRSASHWNVVFTLNEVKG